MNDMMIKYISKLIYSTMYSQQYKYYVHEKKEGEKLRRAYYTINSNVNFPKMSDQKSTFFTYFIYILFTFMM